VPLSGALARAGVSPVHDRGRVLVDLAALIADGGEAICGIDVLRHQREVFGLVASDITVWRALRQRSPGGVTEYADAVPLRTLVTVAGRRWKIEESFQAAKTGLGLDQHQHRRWTSWHRWATLSSMSRIVGQSSLIMLKAEEVTKVTNHR
jgi:hypothetical protein